MHVRERRRDETSLVADVLRHQHATPCQLPNLAPHTVRTDASRIDQWMQYAIEKASRIVRHERPKLLDQYHSGPSMPRD